METGDNKELAPRAHSIEASLLTFLVARDEVCCLRTS
jgi:hypothetical protein